MTDLQCPATVVLLDAGTEPPPWLDRHRIAARFELADPCDVSAAVEEIADRFRGEACVVAAPADAVALALRRWGLPGGPPLLVDVDSEGLRLVP